ncbi:extracellular solute-binding protein [Paenibacillus sp. LHD-117]|uniref:extracellular solute-binding protein n=1 Tax=Paenibacillus sp. LHD-117 TaxID=3071412 RepID=UPI0027E0582F|nr:extracellular solute-binding protein [Paenibacillus sp. LHD-117]MDQ6419876.1 extracellular solute-binding protein [Paenibacillus sp. LHD-117]
MKRRKGLLSILLSFVAVSVLLAGCSGGSNTPGNSEATNAPKESKAPEEAGPVEFPESMSYWVQLNPNAAATMANLGESKIYQQMEKVTGTKVTWTHPSGEGAQIEEQFNLMLASKKLPDVIERNWLTVSRGPDDAIKSGTILRLNELIEEHAPNLTSYLNEHPEIKKMIMTDEGNIYTFPFIRGHEKLMVFFGPILRKDLLDKTGLPVPETIDEWEKTLEAMKELNNGEPPFVQTIANIKVGNAFIGAFGIPLEFYNDNGTIKYGSMQPEYKEFLTVMNRWYEKGLLDPDFAAMDSKLMDSKVTTGKTAAFVSYTGSGIGKYMGLMKDDPSFQLISTPYPTLNKGENAVWGQRDFPYTGIGAAITTAAKNPEQIVKWLDYAYGPEGHNLFNFGVEGESFTVVDNKPTYTDVIMKNPNDLPITQAMAQYIRASYNGPFIQDPGYIEQYLELPAQKEALVNWEKATTAMMKPLTTPNAEEGRKIASIMTDLNVYHEEMMLKFIMGTEPLEKFDEYVETLKAMGIEEVIKLEQAALERFLKR